jgi:tetratricopeptide (TPR) repeat protein
MMIGRAVSMQGRFNESEMYLAQAVSPLEQIADWMDWVFTTAFLGFARAARGNYVAGLVDAERALTRAQEINNPTAIGMSHILLSLIHLMGGNWRAMLDEAYATVEVALQAGDRLYVYIGYGFRSMSENLLGNFKAAHASASKRKEVAQSLGGNLIGADWCAAFDAEIALNLGCVEDAISLAQQATNIAQATGGLLGGGWAHRAWGRALARLTPPRWDEAEAHLAESLHLLEAGDARLEAARTHVVWGNICRERGHHHAAREHFEKASAQFKVSELNEDMKRTRALTFDAIETSGLG